MRLKSTTRKHDNESCLSYCYWKQRLSNAVTFLLRDETRLFNKKKTRFDNRSCSIWFGNNIGTSRWANPCVKTCSHMILHKSQWYIRAVAASIPTFSSASPSDVANIHGRVGQLPWSESTSVDMAESTSGCRYAPTPSACPRGQSYKILSTNDRWQSQKAKKIVLYHFHATILHVCVFFLMKYYSFVTGKNYRQISIL